MSERKDKTPSFKRFKYKMQGRIDKALHKALRKAFGPMPFDRDYPDPNPAVNEEHDAIRIEHEAEKLIRDANIETKEDAIRLMREHTVASYADWEYRGPLHHRVTLKASLIAKEEFGADRDEIDKVYHEARIEGATLRSRDDF